MPPAAAPTVRDLDTRIDDIEKAFIDFKGRIDTIVTLAKWLAGFTAATLISLLFLAFSAIYSAGRLEGELSQHGKAIGRLNDKMDALIRQVEDLKNEIRRERTPKGNN